MDIRIDDLQGTAVQALLRVHLDAMHSYSPPESVHALDLDALRHPSITFWTAWDGDDLMGCGALKQLSTDHAELKSMRTGMAHLRKGVARAMLRHIELEARTRGIQRISLETGSHPPFIAAQKLYLAEGYVESSPFADYALDPFSMFMTKSLQVSSCASSIDTSEQSPQSKTHPAQIAQVLAMHGTLHLRDEWEALRQQDVSPQPNHE